MNRDLERRILEHNGTSPDDVALLEDCTVDEVEDTRRRFHRSPRTGRHVLDQPVHSLSDSDWALAMRSNDSPFL